MRIWNLWLYLLISPWISIISLQFHKISVWSLQTPLVINNQVEVGFLFIPSLSYLHYLISQLFPTSMIVLFITDVLKWNFKRFYWYPVAIKSPYYQYLFLDFRLWDFKRFQEECTRFENSWWHSGKNNMDMSAVKWLIWHICTNVARLNDQLG